MLPMTSHLFSSGSYRSIVFPISEPIQPPEETQEQYGSLEAFFPKILIMNY